MVSKVSFQLEIGKICSSPRKIVPFFKFTSAASKKLILDQRAVKIWNRVLVNTLCDLFDFDLNISN